MSKSREVYHITTNNVTVGGVAVHQAFKLSSGADVVSGDFVEVIEKSAADKLAEALEFYSKSFVNGGAYIGNIWIDKVHGNDTEVIGAFAIAGKRARQALKEYLGKDE